MSQTPTTKANSAPRKPRFALSIATVFGLGYIPKAPGTLGSLAAIPLYFFVHATIFRSCISASFILSTHAVTMRFLTALLVDSMAALAIAAIGVWASSRAASFAGQKDPQFVVVDEVSGQHLTYCLASALTFASLAARTASRSRAFDLFLSSVSVLNWKFLLAGFILFRVFDIWKPFPARQAESLPSGWGIMADDWIAAVYAALGLWLLRALGL
ncbi:MAG TPA: phosphatidylglycerophosphatase A [Methylomirabilota bacterium]|nr:phosphatidylglycerophosphatase A [Methylomirabilota bacterium]